MLAYVFWHRPAPDVEPAAYEDALRAFHSSLTNPSASFRLQSMPFGDHGPGYEDWYLVDDWNALGELNVTAVDAAHKAPHDAAARRAAAGWGGVYALVGGDALEPPEAARWSHERPQASVLWQRQMVLGPAPEYCAAGGDSTGRTRVA